MGSSPQVSRSTARAFARRATLIDQCAPNVATALHHLGYIQLDPLNVCGRMQDLILRNRVVGYCEGDLLRELHGRSVKSGGGSTGRQGFEHYIPGKGILAAWPLEAYPFVRAYLQRIHPKTTRRPLASDEEKLADHVLQEITDRGPLMSDHFVHEGRGQTGWGSSGRLVKIVLEKLFAAGRLLISERRGFRRIYDLPHRVLPDVPAALPSDNDITRWLAHVRFQQRRLVALQRADRELLGDLLQIVRVEDHVALGCLREDVPLLDQQSSGVPDSPLLLAPLDPLIYDRKLTRTLWDFDFTWEVYTPPAARRRGYYSLPALAGLELIGDVEPRADRKRGRLVVHSRRIRRGHSTSGAVADLAGFLGLKT